MVIVVFRLYETLPPRYSYVIRNHVLPSSNNLKNSQRWRTFVSRLPGTNHSWHESAGRLTASFKKASSCYKNCVFGVLAIAPSRGWIKQTLFHPNTIIKWNSGVAVFSFHFLKLYTLNSFQRGHLHFVFDALCHEMPSTFSSVYVILHMQWWHTFT